jgi:hypothetical protein
VQKHNRHASRRLGAKNFRKERAHGEALYRSGYCIPTHNLNRDRWNAVTSTYQAGTDGSYKAITGDRQMKQYVYVFRI